MNTSNRKCVLIADDVDNNARVLEAMLYLFDIDIEVAKNGAEAIEKAQKLKPDLILMDIAMPGMDGFTATQQIREQSSDDPVPVPIIAISADLTQRNRDRIEQAEFDRFISKPIDVVEFQTLIGNLLGLTMLAEAR